VNPSSRDASVVLPLPLSPTIAVIDGGSLAMAREKPSSAAVRRGATRVVAYDVGHGQLDWGLRNDPRVVVIEKANARTLELSDLPGPVDIVTIDVSFISLRHIFPRVLPLLRPGADVVALVKPQFEAGRGEVGKKGVVRDPAVQERVVHDATQSAAEVGLARVGMTESPITGDTGNREFFLHLRGQQ